MNTNGASSLDQMIAAFQKLQHSVNRNKWDEAKVVSDIRKRFHHAGMIALANTSRFGLSTLEEMARAWERACAPNTATCRSPIS